MVAILFQLQRTGQKLVWSNQKFCTGIMTTQYNILRITQNWIAVHYGLCII